MNPSLLKRLLDTFRPTLGSTLLWFACFLLIASVVGGWLVTPLQGTIRGYALPLIGDIRLSDGLVNSLRLFSFGSATGVLALFVGLQLIFPASQRTILLLAVGGFTVSLYLLCKLFFLQPDVVEALAAQNRQADNLKIFLTAPLPGQPTARTILIEERSGNAKALVAGASDTTTLRARQHLALSQLGVGWYLTSLASLLLLLCAYRQGGFRQTTRTFVFFALPPLGLIATIMVLPGVAAEYHRLRGTAHLARGELTETVQRFEQATDWSPSLLRNADFVYHLGATLYQLGKRQEVAAHFYLGKNYAEQRRFVEAIQEYKTALAAHPAQRLLKQHIADALIEFGLVQYRQGMVYAAIANWQEALQYDPSQLQSHFYLARAYFYLEHENQQAAIRQNEQLLTLVAHKLLRADIYNNLGDAYSRQGDPAKARDMYRKSLGSYKLVKRAVNLNAQRGLIGR